MASATGMPATGNFRVRLGNVAGTILRVTARAGTTLTVDVEQDDGSAAIGDTVRLVNTAAAMEALKADAIAGSGGGGSGMPWWPTLVDPTLPAWAWINQGGATVVEANELVYLTAPSAATSIRARVISAPATPYIVTTLLMTRFKSASHYGGLVFRESATGELIIFYTVASDAIQVVKFTSPTVFSAVGAVNESLIFSADLHWLQIEDDGTDLFWRFSRDGRNFKEYGTEGRTAFMAGGPDQIGIFVNVDSSGGEASATFASWDVT